MPGHRTKEEITTRFSVVDATYQITIPKHTHCMPISEGVLTDHFWVHDLSWIDRKTKPLLYHDAYYRGIVLAPELVEKVS